MTLQDYAVNLLRRMVDVYSPSGEESEIAQLLESEMKKQGYDVSIDDVGNVVGRMGSGSPTILLSGHMDTVPLSLPVIFSEGLLHGNVLWSRVSREPLLWLEQYRRKGEIKVFQL